MHHRTTLLIIILIPIYVLGVFVADVIAPTHEEVGTSASSLTLTFVGDMMFDRYIREKHNASGYDAVLEDTATLLRESDLVFGNLEGAITTFVPVSNWRENDPDHFTFTFATSVAKTLRTGGFTAVSLANNHSLNFGTEGLLQTKTWLRENELQYVGAPDELYKPLRFASQTPEVVVYAYDTWYARDTDTLIEALKTERDDVFVVVYAHWGDEYERQATDGQKALARRFVDAGADFVVGSHPHVIQSKELYNDKWIYYSLGNFVFDQYFSEEVLCGAVVTLSLSQELQYGITEEFVELQRDGTTKIRNCAQAVAEE